MSNFEFYLSPKQWEEIDTYEAEINLVRCCERRIVIECSGCLVFPKREGSSLPAQLLAVSKGGCKVLNSMIILDNPERFAVSASIFNDQKKQHYLDGNGQEIIVSRQSGKSSRCSNGYKIFGRLLWPPSTINHLVITSGEYLKFCFDESSVRPLGVAS